LFLKLFEMNLLKSYLALFLIFLSSGAALTAQGLSMSPTRLFFSGNPGEVQSQTVTLYNGSAKDYTFSLHYKDWDRKEDGDKVYYDKGALKTSNAAWMSTVQSSVTVPAGTSKEVVVTMRVPKQASASEVTNSMLFFTQLPSQEDITSSARQGLGIITLFELGLHLYNTPPANTEKNAEITAMNFNAADRTLEIAFSNQGNTVLDATSEFELTNAATGAEIKLPAVPVSMLPGTAQKTVFSLGEVPKGDYLGVALIRMAGSNDLRVGEKELKL